MIHKLIVIFGLIFLFSCDEEINTVTIIEKDTLSWKEMKNFKGLEKIKYFMHANEEYIYFYGPDYLTKIDRNGEILSYVISNWQTTYRTLPMNELFYVTYYENGIFFRSTNNPVGDYNIPYLNLKMLDSNNKLDIVPLDYGGPLCYLNSNNQCLIPFFF